VDGACGMHGRGEKCVQGFGGKARRKKTVRKTTAQMGGWDQNGPYRDWLGVGVGWSGITWLRIGTVGGLS
jgi:hypothetical protein